MQVILSVKSRCAGAAEMTQWLRELVRDHSSVPGSHFKSLTTACNSSWRRSKASSLRGLLYAHASVRPTHRHTNLYVCYCFKMGSQSTIFLCLSSFGLHSCLGRHRVVTMAEITVRFDASSVHLGSESHSSSV